MATIIGIAAGAILGIFLVIQNDGEQLEFVDGSSISLVTEKLDFDQGEVISIKIVNSGTVPLSFSDASYGLKITGLDGRILYSPIAAQVISVLEPKEEVTIIWDQIKNDGDPANGGTYKITSSNEDQKVKKSITINIHK